MKQYVITISVHDPARPLADVEILRTGHDAARPDALIASLEALTGMLKLKRTPEAVAQFILDNAAVALANNVILGK